MPLRLQKLKPLNHRQQVLTSLPGFSQGTARARVSLLGSVVRGS